MISHTYIKYIYNLCMYNMYLYIYIFNTLNITYIMSLIVEISACTETGLRMGSSKNVGFSPGAVKP